MPDVTLSSVQVLDKLGHEELKLKQLGLVNHAAGVRAAIVAVLKLMSDHCPPQPLDPSDPP